MLHDQLTVQIMLGGLSTRMGSDKAMVTLGGKTLLERALFTSAVCGSWAKMWSLICV